MARIVVFATYGEPEVLHVVEAEDPEPSDGQIRIRVEAAGVQPFDAAFRRGTFHRFQPARFPAQLGNEVTGIVDATGAGAVGFGIGDESSPSLMPSAMPTPSSSTPATPSRSPPRCPGRRPGCYRPVARRHTPPWTPSASPRVTGC